MLQNARIGRQIEVDGRQIVQYIECDADGEIMLTGIALLKHYNNNIAVDRLIADGSVYSIMQDSRKRLPPLGKRKFCTEVDADEYQHKTWTQNGWLWHMYLWRDNTWYYHDTFMNDGFVTSKQYSLLSVLQKKIDPLDFLLLRTKIDASAVPNPENGGGVRA
jgi:hypothetical protein